MKNYDYMEETVQAICESMINEPRQWIVDVYTIRKRGSIQKYWIGSGRDCPINEIWNGYSCHEVFSLEQGKRIRAAYEKMRESQASEYQKQVMASMRPKPVTEKEKGFFARLFGG